MTPPDGAPKGLTIARIGGVPVVIGAGWFVIAAAITVLVASGAPELGSTAYVVGLAAALSLLVSVLVHEGAHAVMATTLGLTVHRVVANLWGGHTAYDGSGSTPAKAALIAVVGPLANLALGGVLWLATGQIEGHYVVDGPYVAWRIVSAAAIVNLLLGVFNLLPGLPLDGGQIVDAVVWKVTGRRERGLIAAGWSGRLVTVAMVAWVLLRPLAQGTRPSLTAMIWTAVIATVMWQGATEAIRSGQARTMLGRATVEQVVRPVPVLLAADPLAAAAASSGLAVVCDEHGQPYAVVLPEDAAQVPHERWAGTPVSALARVQPHGWVAATSRSADLTDLVQAVHDSGSSLVAATEEGRVLGVVTVRELNAALGQT